MVVEVELFLVCKFYCQMVELSVKIYEMTHSSLQVEFVTDKRVLSESELRVVSTVPMIEDSKLYFVAIEQALVDQ